MKVAIICVLCLCVAGCTLFGGASPITMPASVTPDGDPVIVPGPGIGARVPWANIVGILIFFGGAALAALIGLKSPNIALYIGALGAAIIIGILFIEFWLQVLIGAAILTAAWFAPSLLTSAKKAKENGKAKKQE